MASTTTPVKVLMPSIDMKAGRLTLMVESVDENADFFGEPFNLSINTKDYNEKDREFIESPETVEKARQILKEIGQNIVDFNEDDSTYTDAPEEEKFLGVISEDGDIDEDLADEMEDLVFLAYVSVDAERASTQPIKEFVKNDRIDSYSAETIKDDYSKEVFTTFPANEFPGSAFQFSVPVEIDGEMKRFKLSQLRKKAKARGEESTVVPLRYETSTINKLQKTLSDNSKMDDARKKKITEKIAKFRENAREDKVEELKEVFGIDIDEMLNDEELTLDVTLEVKDFQDNEDKTQYYLVGVIA